jgi:DNA-binding NtrC family response regulator
MERAVALCEGNTIWPEDLPRSIYAEHTELEVRGSGQVGQVGEAQPGRAAALSPTETEERDRIVAVLDAHAGNQTRAAMALGMSRRTLITRLEQYGIPRPRKADSASI